MNLRKILEYVVVVISSAAISIIFYFYFVGRTGEIVSLVLSILIFSFFILINNREFMSSLEDGREKAIKIKEMRRVDALVSDEFPYFDGVNSGYIGYTDYTAMNVDVNDDLCRREPTEQFALMGYANGFLSEMYVKYETTLNSGEKIKFVLEGPTPESVRRLGWMVYLQQKGVDNAPPSTRNFFSIVKMISKSLNERGPISRKFWDIHHMRKEWPGYVPEPNLKMISELRTIYDRAEEEGRRDASQAKVISR